MKIQSLSYLLIETTNLQEWSDYAKDVVGLMKNDSLETSKHTPKGAPSGHPRTPATPSGHAGNQPLDTRGALRKCL